MRRTSLLRLVAPMGAVLVAAAPSAVGGPTRATIAVDGAFDDWTEVRTNPANSSRDGDGSSLPCPSSVDRDCPVPATQVDLAALAWTWDASSLFFFVERFGVTGGTEYVAIYLDTSFDGLMGTGEPVAVLECGQGAGNKSLTLRTYAAVSPLGDPMGAPTGLSDGTRLPGALAGTPVAVVTGIQADAPGLRFEAAIPWSLLGVGPGAAMRFHASMAPNPTFPETVADNMGGTGGAVGTTAWRAVSASAGIETAVQPGARLDLLHEACNAGNVPTRLRLGVLSLLGEDVEIWRDDDGDGVPDEHLATDAAGDGRLDRPADSLLPAGDSDGDGLLDSGPLPAWGCISLVLRVAYGSSASGRADELAFTATREDDPALSADAVDVVHVGTLAFWPSLERQAAAGTTVLLPHVLQNDSRLSARVDVDVASLQGWAYDALLDPTGDGDPADAVPLVDLDGTGIPDVGVPAGERVHLLFRTVVPPGSPTGQVEIATACAVVSGQCRSQLADRITVRPAIDVWPDHLADTGDERRGSAGGSVYFSHRVVNALAAAETIALSAVSDQGWPTVLLTDPDGDGRPYDSVPVPGGLPVDGLGGSTPFIVRVDLPATAAVGTGSRIAVTAWAASLPGATDTVWDDAVSVIVTAYGDEAHALALSTATPCQTIHAVATGLPPSSSDLRFAWRRSDGTAVRVQPVLADGVGTAEDMFTLAPSDVGAGWSVDVALFDGFTWIVQDTATFDVVDPVELRSITLGASTYHFASANVAASAEIVNTSADVAAENVGLRWIVLTPAGDQALLGSGAWVPFTGPESTATSTINRLEPLAGKNRGMAVANVDFPTTGTYRVEIRQGTACGGEFLAGWATFRVVDDADGDGLEAAGEAALGADPLDADTDDDGLADGAEGAGDSDGDGTPDVLECDADGDALPDGLEAGAWSPSPDTDVVAGCFRPDQWPGTRTDPRRADTDGGGVPDGREDVDADGRVDAGETNPEDRSDDAAIDTDRDGVPDVSESAAGTDPADADSDDDGVDDGAEWDLDSDGDLLPDALECDADDDGLPDGLESGLSFPGAATDPTAGCFVADADPSTTTDSRTADTDGGGVPDGLEDADGNGATTAGETDPRAAGDDDTDGDGLANLVEDAIGTSRSDTDSDEDGVRDGVDGATDADGDGRADALECDSDGDGLEDGLERGLITADPGTDAGGNCFVADSDPSTTTDPADPDTDGGGTTDGAEDADGDGRADARERNPLDASDDECSSGAPGAVTGLRVARTPGGVRLAWQDVAPDACTTYTAWSGASPQAFVPAAGALVATWVEVGATAPREYFLVSADSRIGGPGPLGP